MGQTTNIIELKHITKTYEDGYTAVSDFNLEVKQGEFITFLGPSGCGKTTTLRMIRYPDRRRDSAERHADYQPASEQKTDQYGIPAVRIISAYEHL